MDRSEVIQRALKAYLPVILWMGVIYLVSTDIGSSNNTSRFIGPLVRWIYPEASDETIRVVQAIIRKTGHLVEYAILAMLMWRARRVLRGNFREWLWPECWVILPMCVLYAATDEWHQSFVSTRQGSLEDVMIDSIGAVLGLVLIWTKVHRSTLARSRASNPP